MKKAKAPTPDNYDAFISYRHATGFYMAQVIYEKLVQNGYSVFMDKRLERGKYETQLRTAVRKSRNFILVLFPGDLDATTEQNDWLRKEANWASDTPNMNFIPVFCDGFSDKNLPKDLPAGLRKVLKEQGIKIHKDYSLDTDLARLCDKALANVNPVKPLVNTIDFFRTNLKEKKDQTVESIDMAFHAGAAWLRPGHQKDILDEILQRKIPTRILVNTPEAAESIAKHMRDEYALYFPFAQVVKLWGKYAEDYADFLEVRVCPVPLLRLYHHIRFQENPDNHVPNRIHVKYYAYQNTNLENSFEHELSAFSKYYTIYQQEFEFLWNAATSLPEKQEEPKSLSQ